jgi:hypothetical protein
MSDRYRHDEYDDRPPVEPEIAPPLPTWLASRLLREDEKVTWVCGPHWNPPLERFITHPALFLVALLLGGTVVGLGVAVSNKLSEFPMPLGLLAIAFVLGSIFVLALSCAYFTRLVVTSQRLLILQGYEVCRSFGIDDLPRSLIRYGRMGERGEMPTVDLDAVKTMFGASSGHFAESKDILKFGKQLERIRAREDEPPDSRRAGRGD